MKLVVRRLSACAAACAVCLALSACGTDEPEHAGQTVPVKLRDFRIKAPEHAAAGETTLAVRNKGPMFHELLVIRYDEEEQGEMPMRRDGVTVDEDGLGDAVVGVLEPEPAGDHSLKVDLEPGEYYLICNMAGHYLGGMEAELEVQ
jgi:uncharacterized cupredoxin-like copper-binding protein